jgi:DNA-binding NtrC family response regulator
VGSEPKEAEAVARKHSRKRSNSILVVDDAPGTREWITRSLEEEGFEGLSAAGVMEAISILDARAVDVVVTELRLRHLSGMDLVRHVRENCQDTAVVVITGDPSVESAVEAIKAGAEDFLPKASTGPQLLGAIKAALASLRGRMVLQSHRAPAPLLPGLIGASEPMRRVARAIVRCAASDAPLLIIGPCGSGKKLAARTVHYSSSRASEPFIPVDLAAIPDERAEHELFGKANGAHGGLFAAVRAGTLFLDNLERATASLQDALAQIAAEATRRSRRASAIAGEATPEGRTERQRIAAPGAPRLIGASPESINSLARRGTLQANLLHYLTAATIEMPALSDRGDDVLALAAHFASQAAARAGRPVPRFTDQAIAVLRSHAWPGQVSELHALVETLVLSGSSSVDVTDLPPAMRFSAVRERALHRPLAEVELEHIENVVAAVGGNRARAAEILRIDRKTLRGKMRQRGLPAQLAGAEPARAATMRG